LGDYTDISLSKMVVFLSEQQLTQLSKVNLLDTRVSTIEEKSQDYCIETCVEIFR